MGSNGAFEIDLVSLGKGLGGPEWCFFWLGPAGLG